MEKPVISPQFTIEDIHKLREYNYYLIKDMTTQEKVDYYNKKGWAFLRKKEFEALADEVRAWDPDFTKVTPAEDAAMAKAIREMEAEEYVLYDEIDWG